MTDSFTETMESLCKAAEAYEASDLLLHEARPPLLRISGKLRVLESAPLNGAFFEALRRACGATEEAKDYDTSFTSAEGIRFRVNLLRQLGRHAAVLRRIRSDIPDLETLGLPVEVLREWIARKSGLILVCGPTGCGKSTTLASCLEWMNQALCRHVVTIEDPIEYLFANRQCLFTQREVGIDTPSFAEGLRRSLRQSPDVILVGEIRDAETAMTAAQASETGHLVLSTLHSSSCTDAIERLQFLFPAPSRDGVRRTLAGQLLGVLCQRLLPGTDGGMIVAAEYFSNIGAMRKYILDGSMADLADGISRSSAENAQSFVSSISKLVIDQLVSEEVASAAADNPQELSRALRGISSSAQATRR
jgi:pilus retraction protein PilT